MWWPLFPSGGKLVGVAIIEAPTLCHARTRVALRVAPLRRDQYLDNGAACILAAAGVRCLRSTCRRSVGPNPPLVTRSPHRFSSLSERGRTATDAGNHLRARTLHLFQSRYCGRFRTMLEVQTRSAIPELDFANANSCGARLLRLVVIVAVTTGVVAPVKADEGGLSFWIPGFFGSLSAAPQVPGFTLTEVYYHASVEASGSLAFARQVPIGTFSPTLAGTFSGNLKGDANLGFVAPGYVFATPVLGGQAAIAALLPFGRDTATLNANLAGTLVARVIRTEGTVASA
jgi:hypothetical protein